MKKSILLLHQTVSIFSLITTILLVPVHAYADAIYIPIKNLKIRQKISRSKGVLVSRPYSIDQKILNIIDLYNIRTLQDYSTWLNTHIKYQKDAIKDIWSKPQDTLIAKFGDCEDFALLTSAVANVLGYQPHFLALVRPGSAHAICTFKENGYYIWFDNSQMKMTQTRSLSELGQYLTAHYNYATILELNTQTNKWSIIYKKS